MLYVGNRARRGLRLHHLTQRQRQRRSKISDQVDGQHLRVKLCEPACLLHSLLCGLALHFELKRRRRWVRKLFQSNETETFWNDSQVNFDKALNAMNVRPGQPTQRTRLMHVRQLTSKTIITHLSKADSALSRSCRRVNTVDFLDSSVEGYTWSDRSKPSTVQQGRRVSTGPAIRWSNG